jgi:hypothetical protein
VKQDRRAAWVLAAFVVVALIGVGWGLPGTDSWAADTLSPRASGLGAIVETYTPGHFNHYPPLHYLLLTLLALPCILVAVARVGTSPAVLEAELIDPAYMTAIELTARAVAIAMAAFVIWNTMRLWTRLLGKRGGLAAGVVVGLNAVFVYYAHTGNLEVPYLFWSTWALVEIDRVIEGEPREPQAILLATAAVLTKDQAAGLFLLTLPVALLLLRPREIGRRRLWKGVALGVGAYAVLSGALVNPTGFKARIAHLVGPASQDWATYPKGAGGALAISRDVLLSIDHFTSWPIALAAFVGVGLVVTRRSGKERVRALVPLLSAVSFTLFFTFGARQTEDRFVLPQSILFFPYAAVTYELLAERVRVRAVLAAAVLVALVPALLGVASMDATLVMDARYEAERFLAALPEATRVEVYGGPHFLPRLPRHLQLTRVSTDDPAGRSHIPGVVEVLDPSLDVSERAPEVIVLSTEFSDDEAGSKEKRPRYGVISYTDETSRRFFAGLTGGGLGYERVVRARCVVPWPLRCRQLHGSTGRDVWVFRRQAR